jgi:hypothetical protein
MRAVRKLWCALLWAAAAGALLAAGLLGVGAAIVALTADAALGDVQRAALRALYAALLRQALLPQAALALLLWLAAARLAPRLDRGWRPLAASLLAASALAFLPVGAVGFAIWTPAGPRDVAGTLLLMTASVATALLLPRLLPPLRPGAFGARGTTG